MTENSHLGRLPREENVMMEDGKTQLLAERKSVHMIENIVRKFIRRWDLGTHASAGTFPTAYACMQLPRHKRLVGCSTDDE